MNIRCYSLSVFMPYSDILLILGFSHICDYFCFFYLLIGTRTSHSPFSKNSISTIELPKLNVHLKGNTTPLNVVVSLLFCVTSHLYKFTNDSKMYTNHQKKNLGSLQCCQSKD